MRPEYKELCKFHNLVDNAWTMKYISSMKRNIHSIHIEDLCLYGRKEALQAFAGLVYIKNKLGTFTDAPVITIKYDGYAIIAGWIGERFFVSSKSLFNKEPKINFTDEDIDRNHSGGLAKRLHYALNYLKGIIPKGKIYQGDYLFDNELLSQSNNYFFFQPNTICYSANIDSPLGQQIKNNKIGIIFHTEYQISDNDLKTIELKSFNSNLSQFINAELSLHKIAPLSNKENEYFNSLLDSMKLCSKIDYNSSTIKNLSAFVNFYVRTNTMQTPQIKAMEFENWITEKANSEIAKKKTEKGKQTEIQKWKSSLEYAKNKNNLVKLFTIHDNLTKMKMLLLKKLNTAKLFDTYLVKIDNSLIKTENEGYVLTKTPIAGCKLVDRYTFSLANFSLKYKKGWNHD